MLTRSRPTFIPKTDSGQVGRRATGLIRVFADHVLRGRSRRCRSEEMWKRVLRRSRGTRTHGLLAIHASHSQASQGAILSNPPTSPRRPVDLPTSQDLERDRQVLRPEGPDAHRVRDNGCRAVRNVTSSMWDARLNVRSSAVPGVSTAAYAAGWRTESSPIRTCRSLYRRVRHLRPVNAVQKAVSDSRPGPSLL